MTDPPHSRRYDFLVVGAGLAGLSCALRLARLGRVAVLAKRDLFDSNTQWAQGGIAAVWNPGDSFEAHIADTLAAGADLNRRDAVEVWVREGPDRIRELIDLGVRFTRDEGGGDGFHLTREGGHSERRVLPRPPPSPDLHGLPPAPPLRRAIAAPSMPFQAPHNAPE